MKGLITLELPEDLSPETAGRLLLKWGIQLWVPSKGAISVLPKNVRDAKEALRDG